MCKEGIIIIVVTAMLRLIVIGTTTVDVGAEQSGEQEEAVEESVA